MTWLLPLRPQHLVMTDRLATMSTHSAIPTTRLSAMRIWQRLRQRYSLMMSSELYGGEPTARVVSLMTSSHLSYPRKAWRLGHCSKAALWSTE